MLLGGQLGLTHAELGQQCHEDILPNLNYLRDLRRATNGQQSASVVSQHQSLLQLQSPSPRPCQFCPPRASSLPDEGHEARADFWMRGKPQLEQETHFPKASVPSGRLTSMCHVPAHLELLHWRNCLSHPASSLVNRKRAGRPASEPILGLESCVLILETSVGSSVIGWWAGGAKYARVGDSGCWRIVDESYAGRGGLTWPPCDARDKSHRMDGMAFAWLPHHGQPDRWSEDDAKRKMIQADTLLHVGSLQGIGGSRSDKEPAIMAITAAIS